ncbi:MAG: type II toxin-antitoxin system RelE/ParE family toxin [Bacteroidetes bacterium]|nr:type II toxin-antitoxin system RelE/ParE family toxin [Bacteroidota bacterium]
MESSRDMNTVGGTETSGNRSAMSEKVANEPAICVSAPRCCMKRMKPPLRSRCVGRPTATLEKRSPINYYQLLVESFEEISNKPIIGKKYFEVYKSLQGLRVGRHIVFYRQVDKRIEIIRILHQQMDLKNRIDE